MHHPITDLRLPAQRHLDLVRAAEEHRLARLARQQGRPPSGRPRRPVSRALLVVLGSVPYVVLATAALTPVVPS